MLCVTLVLQMRKLRPRYISHLAQGHRTNTQWTRAVGNGTEAAQNGRHRKTSPEGNMGIISKMRKYIRAVKWERIQNP